MEIIINVICLGMVIFLAYSIGRLIKVLANKLDDTLFHAEVEARDRLDRWMK